MQSEKQNLKTIQLQVRNRKISDRLTQFRIARKLHPVTYLRTIMSVADREIIVKDPSSGELRNMLMFASNNYLGLANHPHVKDRVRKAIDEFGCGIGGPPLLNGYIRLIQEAEERLAALKGQQAALLYSSGFMANIGIVGALAERNDVIIYDELSHASFYDGTLLTKAKAVMFSHNDMQHLETLLAYYQAKNASNILVCAEGVYSMDGNLGHLDKMAVLCKKYGALFIVDDAHGTGVLGENGSGTASFLHCSNDVDINMGTFSKVFATSGGFVAASADMVDYLRFNSRPYIFSASVSPPVAATVLGGLDVMEKEPWLRTQLLENVKYAIEKLSGFGFYATPEAAIIALKIPELMDMRKASCLFHQKNIFINPIEYPAVPVELQRFRISLMSTHTKQDIDKLANAVEEVWNDKNAYSN